MLTEVWVEATDAVSVTRVFATAGLALVTSVVVVTMVVETSSVKFWTTGVPKPLLAVMTRGKLPAWVGIPASTPPFVKVTPVGSAPVWEKLAAGKPLAVTWKLSL